jgi:thymidylate kinase
MIYLNEQHSTLGSTEFRNCIMGLLDHGPIYMLTSLYMMGLDENGDQDFNQWWKKKLNEWTSYLDAIIWLDAPNSVLVERINERESEHPIKGFPEADMGRFLNRYREAYDQVISIINSNGHQIELIEANSVTESSKQIENRILEVVKRFSNEKELSRTSR